MTENEKHVQNKSTAKKETHPKKESHGLGHLVNKTKDSVLNGLTNVKARVQERVVQFKEHNKDKDDQDRQEPRCSRLKFIGALLFGQLTFLLVLVLVFPLISKHIEGYLFPKLLEIPKIQENIKNIDQKVELIGQGVSVQKDDLEALKLQVADLKMKVGKVSAKAQAPVAQANSVQLADNLLSQNWKRIQELYRKGSIFEQELKEILPNLPVDISAKAAVLLPLSAKETKTQRTLAAELYQMRSDGKIRNLKDLFSWVVTQFKNTVRVEKENSDTQKSGDKTQAVSKEFSSMIDQAIALLDAKKLGDAIHYVENQVVQYPKLKTWLQDAKDRYQCEIAFEDIRGPIEGLLKK